MKPLLIAVSAFGLIAFGCGDGGSDSPDARLPDSGGDPTDAASPDSGGTSGDSDGDGIPDSEDVCAGDNTTGDFDHDGVCDGQFLAAEPCLSLTFDEISLIDSGPGVAFSPDGARVAVMSGNGNNVPLLRVYGACDTPDAGEIIAGVQLTNGGFRPSYAIAYSPHGEIAVFSGVPNEYHLLLFGFVGDALMEVGNLVPVFPVQDMDQLVWSKDGQKLAAMGDDRLWLGALDPFREVAEKDGILTDLIGGVDFDSTGECLWAAGKLDVPDLWHVCNDFNMWTPELEVPGGAFAIDVSPDDELVALSTGMGPAIYRVSDLLGTGVAEPARANYADGEVRVGSIAWHPAGTYLAASGRSYFYIMAYDREAHALVMRAEIRHPVAADTHIQGAAFSPDGHYLAIRSQGSLRIYPVTKAQ